MLFNSKCIFIHFVFYQLYKNIEELDVQNNNITKRGTNYLLAVGEYVEIKKLNLKANKFGAEVSNFIILTK